MKLTLKIKGLNYYYFFTNFTIEEGEDDNGNSHNLNTINHNWEAQTESNSHSQDLQSNDSTDKLVVQAPSFGSSDSNNTSQSIPMCW